MPTNIALDSAAIPIAATVANNFVLFVIHLCGSRAPSDDPGFLAGYWLTACGLTAAAKSTAQSYSTVSFLYSYGSIPKPACPFVCNSVFQPR